MYRMKDCCDRDPKQKLYNQKMENEMGLDLIIKTV